MKQVKSLNLSYREWRLFGCVWNYEDYAVLLNDMLDENKIILGGDILTYSQGTLCSTGCGWYYDGENALASNVKAQTYLSGLSNWSKTEKLYITFCLKALD